MRMYRLPELPPLVGQRDDLLDMLEIQFMTNLIEDISGRLSGLNHQGVVLAGGAIRDFVLNRPARDYDLFVLGGDSSFLINAVQNKTADLRWAVGSPSATPVAKRFKLSGRLVEIICVGSQCVKSLIDSFDWNICCYAFDGERFFDDSGGESWIVSNMLRLHNFTSPEKSLRRGYRFSDRYQLGIECESLTTLCRSVLSRTGSGVKNELLATPSA